jgi:hypothetical protein
MIYDLSPSYLGSFIQEHNNNFHSCFELMEEEGDVSCNSQIVFVMLTLRGSCETTVRLCVLTLKECNLT